jgi:serine/threonine protein kinase
LLARANNHRNRVGRDMEKVLKGRYEVLKSVGLGGMSEVWLALDTQTRQTVAVKVLDKRLTQDDTFPRRFSQELAIARLLVHPGIPRLIDDGQTEDGIPFIVMEYVQGITLTEYIKKKGPLPIDDVLAIASQVLAILTYAYSKGIQAHRDIKPGNIMIDLRTQVVTVMDFGIAKTVGSSLTHSTVLYTPKYAAPEQLLPSKFGGVVDKRADLYALGVVLYEMLTGKAPFNGETPAEISGEQVKSSPPSPSTIRRDIPAPLSQILLKCLQANPSHRYQTPEDLLQDLTAGHVREPSKTPSAPRETTETVIRKEPLVPLTPEPLPPPHRRSRVLIPLLLAAIIPVTMLMLKNKGGPETAVTSTTLTITSTPTGAEVFLDGVAIGTTPVMNRIIKPGTYAVKVALAGYEEYGTSLELKEGEARSVTGRLVKTAVAPTTGILTVTSTPAGAQVFLDGTDIGTTPVASKAVALGAHTLRVTLSGYNDYSTSIALGATETRTVAATLTKTSVAPSSAALVITSSPSGARIYLAGKDTGKVTPGTFAVTPGTHTVKLTKDGYTTYQGSVQLTTTGTTTTLPVTLVKVAVVPASATLTVTSAPSGAIVVLDGEDLATTPLPSWQVTPGTHSIRLTLAGYDDYVVSVSLKAGETRTVAATLIKTAMVPTTGALSMNSAPSGALVYLDGTYIGTTPITKWTVTSGTCTVWFMLPGYDDYSTRVLIQAGGSASVNATLTKTPVTPTTGTLTITSSPSGASVYLDGFYVGTTPITTPNVTSGAHALRVTLAGYDNYTTSVVIEAGETKSATATLTRTPTTGTLTIISSPSGAQVFLNGTSIGTTPITNRTVTPGTHTVRITFAGYDDYTTSVQVQAGETKSATATLTKAPLVAPTLLSPVNATAFSPQETVAFMWTPVPGAQSYNIQVFDGITSTYVSHKSTTAGNSYELPAFQLYDGKVYAWTVQSVTSGITGPWSTRQYFSVYDWVTTVVSPSDYGTVEVGSWTTTVTFYAIHSGFLYPDRWEFVVGAGSDAGAGSVLIRRTAYESSAKIPKTSFQSGGDYWWTVDLYYGDYVIGRVPVRHFRFIVLPY